MYNPDKNPLSTAGDYRFTVDYDAASFPLGGTSGYIAVGSALDGWDDPKFSEPTNRLVSIDGFDGRYMALTDSLKQTLKSIFIKQNLVVLVIHIWI